MNDKSLALMHDLYSVAKCSEVRRHVAMAPKPLVLNKTTHALSEVA